MPRLRLCSECNAGRRLAEPSIWHDPAAWPHEVRENSAPAVHDDISFRRAYGFGKPCTGMRAGLGREFDSRADHHAYLAANGLVEASQDTPKRARPSAVELARKRRLFEKAYEKARRGPIC